MPTAAQLAFSDVAGGMNAWDSPHKIGTNQVARMVNCAIVNGMPTTRPGARVVPLEGLSREFVSTTPIQGSIFYNPAKGQGGIEFAASNASLALAVGGRKFLVTISGRRTSSKAMPLDITSTFITASQNHLVVLSQWEDLLIGADGEAKTFIYSPRTGTRFSNGYNTVDKLKSEIPNGAFVLFYAHARGGAVVDSRKVIVGDSLHRTNLSDSSNLTQTTEQVHWATGQFFLPPSAMGNITAAAILPIKNTLHGHGDILLHCEDGIFSLNLNEHPRSTWADKPLVKHAKLQDGAVGPYAVAITDGDQFYRSRKGGNSLRSAAAMPSPEGNPDRTISPEVDTWFSTDYPRWLRFACVTVWDRHFKAFYSTGPIVRGSYRWHRGLVVRNTDPVRTRAGEPAAWEGLWTLPMQMRGIIQTVNGIFDGEERLYAWTRGFDRRNRLVEFSEILHADMLEDGTEQPIRCQVITRAIDAGKWWQQHEFTAAKLFLRNIEGTVNWGVWFRPAESVEWIPLRAGKVRAPSLLNNSLVANRPASLAIPLGDLPKQCANGNRANESRSCQFLVRWEGYCTFEGLKVAHGDGDLSKDELDKGKFDVTFDKPTSEGYDDFEYSATTGATWIESQS